MKKITEYTILMGLFFAVYNYAQFCGYHLPDEGWFHDMGIGIFFADMMSIPLVLLAGAFGVGRVVRAYDRDILSNSILALSVGIINAGFVTVLVAA